MSKVVVGKGALYLYIETIVSMISGYIFWLVMSKITMSDTIGVASTVIAFVTIIVSIVTLGIPSGIQRFLSKQLTENDTSAAQTFFRTALILLSFSVIIGSASVWLFGTWMQDMFKIDASFLMIAITLLAATAYSTLLRGIVISTLRTKSLAIGMILATSVKLVLTTLLIMVGQGSMGILIGFTVTNILLSVIFALAILTLLETHKTSRSHAFRFLKVSKEVLIASSASWLPSLIMTVGSQLGTIAVFQSKDASQAGVYFIAFAILNAMTGITYSLLTISYPVLSSLTDGRKRFAWKMTKLTLIISMPVATSLLFYSSDVLRLLANEYVMGAPSLEILLISVFPIAVFTGVNQLVYAYGNYRSVLALGLAANIPRTALYFLLVPLYGGLGAAASFTIGSFCGLIAAVLLARKLRLKLYWKDIAIILALSATVPFSLSLLEIHYLIGIISSIMICYLVSLRLRILSKSDVADSLSLLPPRLSRPLSCILERLSS